MRTVTPLSTFAVCHRLSSTLANSYVHIFVCTEHQKGCNLYLSPWQLSRCHAGVSSEAIRDLEGAGCKGFDADRDQSGTKKTWKKIKKVSTCAAATVANGFFAVTRSKWKSCAFFEALERLEVLNFPAFARHHNLAVCLTGQAARQTPRCTCGLFRELLKRNND